MFAKEVLNEMDATLDQLIQNAKALQGVDMQYLSEIEIDAFQKTQESLLHHLLHMDEVFETKSKSLRIPNKKSASYKIQEKLKHFEQLKQNVGNQVKSAEKKHPILGKRRKKRLLKTQ